MFQFGAFGLENLISIFQIRPKIIFTGRAGAETWSFIKEKD